MFSVVIKVATLNMRVCWNRQTGTFEGRVSLAYGFKSRHSHQSIQTRTFYQSVKRSGLLFS